MSLKLKESEQSPSPELWCWCGRNYGQLVKMIFLLKLAVYKLGDNFKYSLPSSVVPLAGYLICMQASWCFLLSAGSKKCSGQCFTPNLFFKFNKQAEYRLFFYCKFYKSPIGRLIKDRFPQTYQLFLCSCSGADQTRVPCSMLPRENGACAQSTKVNWIYVRLLTWADCPQILAKMLRLKNGPFQGVFKPRPNMILNGICFCASVCTADSVGLPELEDNLRTISSHYCNNALFSGIVEEVKLTQDPEPQWPLNTVSVFRQ